MGPRNSSKPAISIGCLSLLCGCLLLLCSGSKVLSQHIPITNPSLEDRPAERVAPLGWSPVATSDVQPGVYNITKPPSDGQSYVGLHSGPGYIEGISQRLAGTLKAGYSYSTSFDLAYAPIYAYDACYGNLAIFGGNSEGEMKELLWASGEFHDSSWVRYNVSFVPSGTYTCLTLVAHYSSRCNKSLHGAAVLIDNLFPWLYEQPKLEFRVTSTCVNESTGTLTVMPLGGDPPYTYLWAHNGAFTPTISQLPAGQYDVVVTDSKGISAQGSAMVNVTDLASQVTVTPSRCHGDDQNSISLQTSGGLPPYRYYFNGNNNVSYTPVFDRLKPGVYAVRVRDEQGCMNELKDILVEEPPLLEIRSVTVKPCSCSEVNNGRIIPQAAGGVPPYEYRVNNGLWQPDSVLGGLQPGNYLYEIKDNNDCRVTGNAEIISPYKNCFVILPTAFSPNGDGNNDVFRPKVYDDVHNYQLRIYNRWGSLIFSTNDPGAGWNGNYQGRPVLAQHYSYVCTFTNSKNMPQELKGIVMLIR